MTQGSDPTPEPLRPAAAPSDPYQKLGVAHDASFDDVQQARRNRLDEVSDDPIERARIEAAYDAVLMDRLKERQQGRLSSAARTASQREQTAAAERSVLPSLRSTPSFPLPKLASPSISVLPNLTMAQGQERLFPLAAHGLLLVLLLALPQASGAMLLALGCLATLFNLMRRQVKFGRAVGWTVILLLVGLLIGNTLLQLVPNAMLAQLPLGPGQLLGAPVLLVLLAGALLLA
jgi:Protein CHAPERONE-LIKE PROTEIN OF POR1-like